MLQSLPKDLMSKAFRRSERQPPAIVVVMNISPSGSSDASETDRGGRVTPCVKRMFQRHWNKVWDAVAELAEIVGDAAPPGAMSSST